MTSRPRPVLLALASLFTTVLGSTVARAQDPEAWIGRRVVTRSGAGFREEFPGKNYQEPVGPPDDAVRITIGAISRVVGEWLELKSQFDSETRWVHEWEVVRYNDAHDYFRDQVKAHPNDATAYLERALFVRSVGSSPEFRGDPLGDPIDPFAAPPGTAPVSLRKSAPALDQGDPFATALALARDLTKPTASGFDQAFPFPPPSARDRFFEISRLPFDPVPPPDPFANGMPGPFQSQPILDDLNEAIRLDPNLAYAHLLRGDVLKDQDQQEEAIAAYSQCIRLAPNDTQAYEKRADLAYNLDRYAEAIKDYSAVIQLDPDREDLYTWIGAARSATGDHDNAIIDLERALRSEPRNTVTIYYYARAWDGKGEHDRAITEFTRALEQEALNNNTQDYSYLFDARGISFCEKGDFDRAINDYSAAIDRAPFQVQYYLNRAEAYREKKQYDLALQDYATAAAVEPRGTRIPIQRSYVLHLQGKQAEAIAALNEVVWLNQKDVEILNNYAVTFSRIKEFDLAISNIDTAIRLQPENTELLLNRATFWNSKGEYDKSIADSDEVIRRKPDHAGAYFQRATSRHMKKQYDEAIADCDEALALEPGNVNARLQRFSSWYQEGLFDKAAEDLNAAAKVAPKSLDVLRAQASFWSYCPEARFRNGRRAVETATVACERTAWKDSQTLSALSMALAETGDFEAAVTRMTRAIELETDNARRKKHNEILDLFKARKPYRLMPSAD
jgi:tetratricopeptide (TPR) repeat protein